MSHPSLRLQRAADGGELAAVQASPAHNKAVNIRQRGVVLARLGFYAGSLKGAGYTYLFIYLRIHIYIYIICLFVDIYTYTYICTYLYKQMI